MINLLLLSLCWFGPHSTTWQPTEFVWNLGLSAQTDRGLTSRPRDYFRQAPVFDPKAYESIRRGELVWLKCTFVEKFSAEVLPKVTEPFVLMITDGDESFPSNCGTDIEPLLNSDKVLAVFAQNCDYQGLNKKVKHLPIGIDFHSVAYKGKKGMWGETGSPRMQEARLKRIINRLQPTNQRLKKAYVDFHHTDTIRLGYLHRHAQFGEDRAEIFEKLKPTGFIDYGPKLKRSKLWETKGQYAFSISPPGNGLDCHRTWEDLVLGCIVIVKSSPLDPLYEGLPVVIVKDWDEITEENLTRWLAQYHDAFTNPFYREKLTSRYWLAQIQKSSLGR